MTLPDRPHDDKPPSTGGEDAPGAAAWLIAGCALVLVYVAVLALLRPSI